jgi:hypothetical protein
MLIILHCKDVTHLAAEALVECFGTARVYRADAPESMDAIETEVVDDIINGHSVLLAVPTYAVGTTYALVEECLKMGAMVFQLKATQRHSATPGRNRVEC